MTSVADIRVAVANGLVQLTLSFLAVVSQTDSLGARGQCNFLLGHGKMHHHITEKPVISTAKTSARPHGSRVSLS